MTILLLIRHGENDVMLRRLTGRMPGVSLNEKGRSQAKELANALAHAPLKAVYSSPLERAVETAEPLAASHGLTVQVRPALIEVHYGEWQGRTYKQLNRLKKWQLLLKKPSSIRFPGGETMGEVQQRVVADLETLAAEWQLQSESEEKTESIIAIVAHADVVRLALAHYLKMALNDFMRLYINSASVSILLHRGSERPRIISINQQAFFSWPEPSTVAPHEKRKSRGKSK